MVVDAVRAGATLVAMAEAGDPEVYLASSAEAARAYRDAKAPHALLGGEAGGLPLEGFDLGNSPAEWARTDLAGKTVVFGTTNGTRAASVCRGAERVCFGAFVNAAAAAEAALAVATAAVKIVCAGSSGRFALDDAVCAGFMVRELLKRGAEPEDSALAAAAIAKGYPDVEEMLRSSDSGRRLLKVGLEADLHDCARLNVSTRVPTLARRSFTAERRLLAI